MQNISSNTTLSAQPSTQSTYRLVENDRMAGTIASYGRKVDNSYASSFAAQEGNETLQITTQDDFTFKDLLDMVNPLQHIPVVNMIYREITGDEIKPASKVMGGAVFGGPVGAASSLVNVVIEEETGDDLTGNALSAIGIKEKAQKQDFITQRQIYDDLPVALLAFAETPLPKVQENSDPYKNDNFEMVELTEQRTAGSIPRYA